MCILTNSDAVCSVCSVLCSSVYVCMCVHIYREDHDNPEKLLVSDSATGDGKQAVKMQNNPAYLPSSINQQETFSLCINPAYNNIVRGNQQPLLQDDPGCFCY